MLLWLSVTAASVASVSLANDTIPLCPEVRIQPERLPDLNLPRAGHITLFVNGELTVVGGHTSGFLPTATAEYLKDGSWHLIHTVYEHDNGIAAPLSSGDVLIAGGHEKSLGIGQTYVAEKYDPEEHVFEGFGCLDKARCLANATELDSGYVIIAGNHYAHDAIECFDGVKNFTFLKEASHEKCYPYILPIAPDDALIFSPSDTKHRPVSDIWIDRLQGDAFLEPLLATWRPFQLQCFNPSEYSFIGNRETGDYSYLVSAQDETGQLGILKVSGTDFSLLPTACPIPMESQWGEINYLSQIVVDRNAQKGYVIGNDSTGRLYVLCIAYGDADSDHAAPLTLFYTDPIPDISFNQPILTDNGDLVMVGGIIDSNFYPLGCGLLFPFGPQAAMAQSEQTSWKRILVWGIPLLILAGLFLRHRRKMDDPSSTESPEDDPSQAINYNETMRLICQVMEDRKLFLNSELKISDLASILETSPRIISETIKVCRGYSFIQFVNLYRIEYAKRLLRQPGVKVVSVYMESGFSNETSFFRTFKSLTGMTPKEWASQRP